MSRLTIEALRRDVSIGRELKLAMCEEVHGENPAELRRLTTQ
jgi:hypothetical protein